MKKILIAFIFVFFGSMSSFASHLMGGEISYIYVGGNNYEVTLIVYNDCAGSITSGNSQTITYQSSCASPVSVSLPLFGSPSEVSQLCSTSLPQSTCGTGSLPGVSERVYKGVIQLPPCVDWIIHWNSNARNAAITNLVNPTVSFYIQNTLNNVVGAFNNSPQFFTSPIPFLCANQLYVFNHGASDVDGDSIYYTLSTPLTGTTPPGIPMTFATGYSVSQPVSTVSGINLNQQTGEMCFTPNLAQFSVVSVVIEEYRNNVLIGTQIREMQVIVSGACNNQPPIAGGVAANCGSTGGMVITTQGPNVTQVDGNSILMCPGDSICFQIDFSDLDAGDNVFVSSNVSTAIPSANFSITGNGTPNATATFCWVPTPLDSGLNVFTIELEDDQCPITAKSTFTYDITVFDEPFAGNDLFICSTSAFDSVQLQASGGSNYVWSVISGDTNLSHLTCVNCDNPIVFPDSTTSYLLTSSGAFLCNNTDTVTIFVGIVPKPILHDTSYCAGLSVPLDAGLGFGTIPYDSLIWGGVVSDTGQIINASVMGNYYVIGWLGGCSISSDTITVTENALPIPIISTASGIFHYCRTDSILLTVQTGFVSYLWSTSPTDTTNSILANSGTKFISVTDTNGCIGSTSQLITSSNPQVSILGSDTICPDSTILLSASPVFSSYTYTWSNGDSTATTMASTGLIEVILNDNLGCSDTANTTVFSNPVPNADFTITPEDLGNTDFDIIFTDNSTGSPLFWLWNFGDGSPFDYNQNTTHMYGDQGTFNITLTIINQYGCTDSVTNSYFILDGIIIPNVFTPNGDGLNDMLVFKNVEYVENHLVIFNRWGKEVFKQDNYQNDWNGKGLNEGTFFFILKAILPGSEEPQLFKGTFTILK